MVENLGHEEFAPFLEEDRHQCRAGARSNMVRTGGYKARSPEWENPSHNPVLE
ncbi:MAG: hypothetical protein AB4352_09085 [Hormoscilla sp.]